MNYRANESRTKRRSSESNGGSSLSNIAESTEFEELKLFELCRVQPIMHKRKN